MKRILFVAACAAWMCGTLSAQTVQIKTAKGETKIYNLSQVESITFSDQPKTEALVTMEVINVSAYSFDLNVTKAASCQKYMATVYRKDIYSESAFIDAAEQTLDPQAYYRPFEKTLSYDSKTFSESELGLNSVASEDGKTDPQYIAAIYAIDD
ncbi:MAG: hypothetical protein HUK03_03855, partial [Bacteroidaceae bacterium]|nr:hypothetical protein [Bacteroidaceae bacterium]